MGGLFLRAGIRNLLRNKLRSLINLASLAIGLTVFGFAFLYVKQELSYNRWPEADRVHRLVVEQRGIPGIADSIVLGAQAHLYPRITEYFADQIENISRAKAIAAQPVDTEASAMTNLLFVDPAFADIFQFELVGGDIARVLSGPGFVAIDERYAERVGYTDGIGGRIQLTSLNAPNVELEYEVAAIYRLPRPVSMALAVNVFTLMHDYSLPLFGDTRRFSSWEVSVQALVKLKPGVSTEAFNAMQAAFVDQEFAMLRETVGTDREVSDHLFHRWQPISDVHFNPLPTEVAGNRGSGDPGRIVTFAVIGLLVLLVGCSNSVSLSLASALERRREIGVRKAAGALQGDILWQQLGEALLLAILALIPTIALLELLQPSYQALLPFTQQMDIGWVDYALMFLIASVTGLASGAYPAFVLSATRPQAVLKAGAQESTKGSLGLRNLLVGVQFCLASMLLIGTAALYLQLAVTREQPLGFDLSNTLIINGAARNVSADVLRNELAAIPGVIRAMPSYMPPNVGSQATGNSSFLVRRRGDENGVNVRLVMVDYDFVDFVGMQVLAGRAYDAALDRRDPPTGPRPGPPREENIVINRAAARALDFATPEEAVNQPVFRRITNNQNGQIFDLPLRIVGVVEDSMYASLRRRPGPELYQTVFTPVTPPFMLRYEESAEASIQQRVQDVVTRLSGVPAPNLVFVEEQLHAAFLQEQNESRVLLICGGIALLLACIGLYGLAAFSMERKVKEVGVRKALGAASSTIVMLFLLRFARPVLIANLLAWPVAIYFVLRWIERFPYQMERAWLLPLCIATALAVLLVATLTVGFITAKAANANPVRSLRYE